ncbi:MAG: transcriptional regulator [Candidatus Stygibacter frigidus]|nr:transcriptional regulator [Candidatus Stygibacter frigidus]
MSGEDLFDYQQLNELLHSKIRTAIVAVLDGVEKAEFSYLKKRVGATDGNLSTHLRKLEEAEYLEIGGDVEGREVSEGTRKRRNEWQSA